MKNIVLAVLTVLTLAGCSQFSERPNNTAAYTSDRFVQLAVQVERAQALGELSEETGDEYLGYLLEANRLLSGATSTYNEIVVCSESQSKFECFDAILEAVEGGL